jgi:class 3 adenylate cyclase
VELTLEKARVERHLAAILAADAAGYSRLMATDEVGTLARLRTHRGEVLDPAIDMHRGRIANTAGDSILAEFGSVVDAVTCAVEIQRSMLERNSEIPLDQRIEFRIGINLGDVISEGTDIFGDGVNVAARLESIADRGGICISRQVLDQVEGKLDLTYRELGRQNLKNTPSRWRFTRSVSMLRQCRASGSSPSQTSSRRYAIARHPTVFGWHTRRSAMDRRC